jgi:osmoprotectant transport system permease protein
MDYILDWPHWLPAHNCVLQCDPGIFYYLGQHVLITALTLALGLAISFPVSLLILRYRRLYTPVIGFAGFLYTLPSLALIPIMVAALGAGDIWPILLPLVAYAQVVLIRNIVSAFESVDPARIEVGRAMGMDGAQVQTRIVLPLALPVVVAGIRVVAVTTIGIATIGPFFGVNNLGYYIFQGQNLHRADLVAAGAILVSAFAIVVDLLLLGLQRALNQGQPAAARA